MPRQRLLSLSNTIERTVSRCRTLSGACRTPQNGSMPHDLHAMSGYAANQSRMTPSLHSLLAMVMPAIWYMCHSQLFLLPPLYTQSSIAALTSFSCSLACTCTAVCTPAIHCNFRV